MYHFNSKCGLLDLAVSTSQSLGIWQWALTFHWCTLYHEATTLLTFLQCFDIIGLGRQYGHPNCKSPCTSNSRRRFMFLRPMCYRPNLEWSLANTLSILHTLRLTAIFPGEPGLADSTLIFLLHLFPKCASFWDRPKLSRSFLTQSHQVFFGCPVCLMSGK